MHKLSILILLPFFLFITCKENTKPVIKLGKILDGTKLEISGETAVFAKNDNLAYVLEKDEAFNTNSITRRLYKGKIYVDMIITDSSDIKIKPGIKKIGGSLSLHEITQKHGIGDYIILFTIQDKVIGKMPFSVIDAEPQKAIRAQPRIGEEKNKIPKKLQANVSVNNSDMTEKQKSDNKMTPKEMLKNMPSPWEMMKDTSK